MNPIASFLAFMRARRLSRIAAREEKRRAVIMNQIQYRREKRKEFRPLYGELKQSTCAALAAECGLEWQRGE